MCNLKGFIYYIDNEQAFIVIPMENGKYYTSINLNRLPENVSLYDNIDINQESMVISYFIEDDKITPECYCCVCNAIKNSVLYRYILFAIIIMLLLAIFS